VAFFAVNRAWMYSVLDHPDSWMYTGYFLHPELLYPRFPDAYQGTRVLHIIVGWLAHHWLPTTEAVFVHKAFYFYLLFFFLYGILHRLFRNERAALIGAIIGVTQGHLIYAQSYNYVSGTILVLLLANLWAQSRMRDTRCLWFWQMLAGAFYVGVVWTYLLLPLLAASVFALFVYCLPRWTWRELFAGLGWAALGGLVMTVTQGLISLFLGGRFWFFLAQVNKASSFMQEDWFQSVDAWDTAPWMPFYGAMLVLALLAIWRGTGPGYEPSPARPAGRWPALVHPLPFVSIIFVLNFFLFVYCDLTGVWPMLENYFLTSFLLPNALLVLGGWVAWLLRDLEPRRQWWLVFAAIAVVLGVYGWGGFYMPKKYYGWESAKWLLPIALVAGVLGVGGRPRRAFAATLVFLLALVGVNYSLAVSGMFNPSALAHNVAFDNALYDTVRVIEPWDRDGQTWFWANVAKEKRIPQLLNYFFLWRSTLGSEFPGLMGGNMHPHEPISARKFRIRPGMRILLFDPAPDEIALAQSSLKADGVELRPLAKTVTPGGGSIVPMSLELWEAWPLTSSRGRPIDLSQAQTAPGVTGEKVPDGELFTYPAGEVRPLVTIPLPPLGPSPHPAPVYHLLIGGNERALTLIVINAQQRDAARSTVDPGAAIRNAWVLPGPKSNCRRLEISPALPGEPGSFVLQSADY
jgi:hypothetical protein